MKTTRTALTLLATAAVALSPAAAFADSSPSSAPDGQATPALDAAAQKPEAQAEAAQQAAPDNLPALKAKAAERIAKRQGDLAEWASKVGATTTDCGQNAAVLARIAATQGSLATLNTAIQGAATMDVAKPLYAQIFTHNRVYLVVSPVTHTALACDFQFARAARIATTVAELQAKLTGAPTTVAPSTVAGAQPTTNNNAAAAALLAQVGPLLDAAKTTSSAAAASLAGITPDQGNDTVRAANAAKVNTAREQIKQADASLDKAQDLVRQARQLMTNTANNPGKQAEKDKREAERKAEKDKREAERKAEKDKREAERKAEKDKRQANRDERKKNKGGDNNGQGNN